jgi:hypothetical protein
MSSSVAQPPRDAANGAGSRPPRRSSMSRAHLAWTLAAGAQIAFVICGAARTLPAGDDPASSALAAWCDVSGADNTYGFFAPSVASQCRLSLTMRGADGRTWRDDLVEDRDSRFAFRLQSAVDAIGKFPEDLRRALTASWAGAMFARHPAAQEVLVEVEVEQVPTMEAWRAGARPEWLPLYKATFVRRADDGGGADAR